MLDLLLKQLGFNAADLKKQVDDAGTNFQNMIDHFNGRFDRLEKQNGILIELLGGSTKPIVSPSQLAIEKLYNQPVPKEQ